MTPRGSSDDQNCTPELAALVTTVERLHRERTVSFVAAGDEKIYAYGGNGFVAIFGEDVFGGLVEVETPTGTIRIEPDERGAPSVNAADGDDSRPVGERLSEATRQLETYYRRRYWKV